MIFATTSVITPLHTVYQQARSRYDADPANPGAIRAMGWAMANVLKDVSGKPDLQPDRMLKGLSLLVDFPMDTTDERWRESVLWSVNRFLLRSKPGQLSLISLAQIVRDSRAFLPQGPSLGRSVWWKALLRHSAVGIDWLGLFDELGWENKFRPEDEISETYGDGKSASPLLESLLQAVVKQLLQTIPLTEELATPWLERLSTLAIKHPDWSFVSYYQAKLLLKLDQPEKAMLVFLPFARRKMNDFWVWGMLADLLPETAVEKRLACFGRALTLRTPEPFLVKIRQRLAELLVKLNRWDNARAELDRIVQTRRENNWPIPVEVTRWLNDPLYTQAIPPTKSWYEQLRLVADAVLYEDNSEVVALVTGFDPSGTYCNIAIDDRTTGSFPCQRFGLRVKIGDRLAVRYEQRTRNGRQQLHILTASVTSSECTNLTIRRVSGPLHVPSNRNIGFVEDVFIPADLVASNRPLLGKAVTIEAIESWDNRKSKMGWSAFSLASVS